MSTPPKTSQENTITTSPILTYSAHNFKHSRKRRLFIGQRCSEVQTNNKKIKLQSENEDCNEVLRINSPIAALSSSNINVSREVSDFVAGSIVDHRSGVINSITAEALTTNSNSNCIFAAKTPQEVLKSRITAIKSCVQKPILYSNYIINNFSKPSVSRKMIAQHLLSCVKSLEEANIVDTVNKLSKTRYSTEGFVALNKFTENISTPSGFNKPYDCSVDNSANNRFKQEQISTNRNENAIDTSSPQCNSDAADVLDELANKDIIFSQWQLPCNKDTVPSVEDSCSNKKVNQNISPASNDVNLINISSSRIVTPQELFDNFEKLYNSSQCLTEKYNEDSNSSSCYENRYSIPVRKTEADIEVPLVTNSKEDDVSNIMKKTKCNDIVVSDEEEQFFKNITFSNNTINVLTKEFKTTHDTVNKHSSSFPFTKESTVPNFTGFSTAGGKSIKINEEHFDKAKKLFADIDNNNEIDITLENMEKGSTFRRKVAVNRDSKANENLLKNNIGIRPNNHIFKNINKINEKSVTKYSETYAEEYIQQSGLNIIENQQISKPIFPGFGTASGKPVEINEESLQLARKIFREINNIDSLEGKEIFDPTCHMIDTAKGKVIKTNEKSVCHNNIEMKNISKPVLLGFGTASGKTVKINENSLRKAKNFFSDIDDIPISTSEAQDSFKLAFQGFGTASGKLVKINEDSLHQAKKIFSDIDNIAINSSDNQNISNSIFRGFGTANGKSVKINERALHQARKMFSDLDEIAIDSLDIKDISKAKFHGFGTASGKPIKTNEQSLHQATKMFADIDDICANSLEMQDISKELCKGFSKTKQQISETSEDVSLLNTKSVEDIGKKDKCKPIILGFGTASGKSVKINEKSLHQARKIFADVEENITNNLEKENLFEQGFKGFGTASGKSVQVSKKSLQYARNFLSDIDENTPEKPEKSNFPFQKIEDSSKSKYEATNQDLSEKIFQGFATAGGTVVQVNENALQQARKMFFEVEDASKSEYEVNDIKGQQTGDRGYEHVNSLYDPKDINLATDGIYYGNSTNYETRHNLNEEQHNTKSKERNDNINNTSESSTPIFCRNLAQNHSLKRKRCLNNENAFKTPDTKCFNTTNNSNTKTSHSTPIDNISNPISFPSALAVNTPENYSLTQEISDSTSALLADEMDNEKPSWLTSFYVTDPSILTDVSDCKSLVITEDMKEKFIETKQIQKSPVLGTNDRFVNKRNFKKFKTRLSTKFDQMSNVREKQVEVIPKSSFKIPYKTTDFVNNDNNSSKTNLVEKDLEYSTPFYNKYKTDIENETTSNKLIVHNYEITDEVKQLRKMALEKQNRDIKYTKNRKLDKKPLKGSYLVTRTSDASRNSWKNLTKGESPKLYSKDTLIKGYKVRNSILSINFNNAVDFIFNACDYYSNQLCQINTTGILIGDGSLVILNEDSNISINEIIPAFLTSPGVDSNLINEMWIKNHYKFIVLKLSGMERNFPNIFANRALTPNNVLLQLKYRYDREIDRTQRSCLKKIFENDDTPNKSMVLYCANIYPLEITASSAIEKQISYEIELSDGWYSIRTQIDPPLSNAIRLNRLKIGDKIHVQGSQLLNCEQGCDPLEVPSDVRFRIYANSSIKMPWDTKLGYYESKPLAKCLGSVHPLGGSIQYTEFIVMRTYPLLYVERIGDKTVIRAEKAELKISNQYEQKRQMNAESVYSQVQKTIEKENENSIVNRNKYKIINEKDLKNITCGKTLTEIIETSNDPTSLQSMLSVSQMQSVSNYYDIKRNEISKEIENRVNQIMSNKPDVKKRQVVQLLKVRVVPICRENKPEHKSSAVLSVWRPSPEIFEILKENTPLIARQCSATGVRSNDLQLSAGRQVTYKRIPIDKVNLNLYPTRTLTKISDINSKDFSPNFNEIDTVGIIIHIGPIINPSSFQTVYIADMDQNVLALSFWNGLKDYGVEDLFNVKTVVACSNLQWKNNSFKWIPCVYASDISTFTSNPKQKYLREYFDMFKDILNNVDEFVLSCEDKLSKSKTPRRDYTPNSIKFANNSSNGNRTPTSHLSVSSMNSVAMMSPMQKRINKLQIYGEPPRLSPIVLNKTKKVLRREFKVPLKITTESNKNKIENKVSKATISPPLSLE